jgi:hypothetical protein
VVIWKSTSLLPSSFSVCDTRVGCCSSTSRMNEDAAAGGERTRSEDILNAGGQWSHEPWPYRHCAPIPVEDRVPSSILPLLEYLTVSYLAMATFSIPAVALVASSSSETVSKITSWHLVGYLWYAAMNHSVHWRLATFGPLPIRRYHSRRGSVLRFDYCYCTAGCHCGSTMVTGVWSILRSLYWPV